MASYQTVAAPRTESAREWQRAMAVVGVLALARIALYLFIAPRYDYFRDELYYLACGEHPAWGYVDQPPMIAWLTWLVRHTIGTSLYALRLLPALAGAALVVMTAQFAREFGARKSGVWLAGLATLVAPIYLAMSHLWTMNAFDPLIWGGCARVMLRIVRGGNPRLWLLFGALAGVGLLNKYGIAFYLAALLAGVLLTPARRHLASPWLWAGIGLAAIIALPNLIWQVQHGFPFLELMRNIRASGRDVALPPLQFLVQQALMVNPLGFLLAIFGVIYSFTRSGREFRFLAVAYLVFTAMMMWMKAKDYYLAPVYPVMIGAGAAQLERWTDRAAGAPRVRLLAAAPFGVAALLVAFGIFAAPLAVPVLTQEQFIAYEKAIGFTPPPSEHQPRGPLPQIFADMHGWRETAAEVAKYYNSLPPEERAKTAIFAENYGGAGAIDFFGPQLGLPKAISGHQSYYFWGPRDYTAESLIIVGAGDDKEMRREFASVEKVGQVNSYYARPDTNRPIFHARGWKHDIRTDWWRAKHWD